MQGTYVVEARTCLPFPWRGLTRSLFVLGPSLLFAFFFHFFRHLLVAANCASRRGRSLGKLLWSRNRVSGAHDPYYVLHLSSLGSPLVPTQWKKECCWCCPSARPPALGKKGDAGSIGWHNPVSRGRVGRGLCVFYCVCCLSGGPGSAQGPRMAHSRVFFSLACIIAGF